MKYQQLNVVPNLCHLSARKGIQIDWVLPIYSHKYM